MSKPGLIADIREIRREWHDPEFRRGFWIGFRPYLFVFPFYVLGGVAFGYAISKLF